MVNVKTKEQNDKHVKRIGCLKALLAQKEAYSIQLADEYATFTNELNGAREQGRLLEQALGS